MYIVDITRENTDMLCGKDSMDAKRKTINYIIEYAMANYEVSINKDILDQNLDMGAFSLKKFLDEEYSIKIDKDLLIQSFFVDRNKCVFLKYKDDFSDFPVIYSFPKNKINQAKSVMRFLVNDALINKYEDDLSKYEELKIIDNLSSLEVEYPNINLNCQIVSLYDKGRFLDELLNNNCSLNELQKNVKRYDI